MRRVLVFEKIDFENSETTLYTYFTTLTNFQPRGRGAAVRVQEYHEGGNEFDLPSHAFFFLQIFTSVLLLSHHESLGSFPASKPLFCIYI